VGESWSPERSCGPGGRMSEFLRSGQRRGRCGEHDRRHPGRRIHSLAAPVLRVCQRQTPRRFRTARTHEPKRSPVRNEPRLSNPGRPTIARSRAGCSRGSRRSQPRAGPRHGDCHRHNSGRAALRRVDPPDGGRRSPRIDPRGGLIGRGCHLLLRSRAKLRSGRRVY
jgi:hypothetical protein